MEDNSFKFFLFPNISFSITEQNVNIYIWEFRNLLGIISRLHQESNYQKDVFQFPTFIVIQRKMLSSEASESESAPSEAVKEVYDKMLNLISEKKTAPPNALLWSIVVKCATSEDIKLLFDILQRLRIFRLSNLRIHDNFNCALCQDVMKACVRVGAIDYGKKALWKHNVYGLTPNMGSAHQLLLHAKQHEDVKLMKDTMNLLKKNDLPLQPGTADIVFGICFETDNWDLLTKYGKRFVKAGVKLRQTSIDTWMEFAVNTGDVDSFWKVENLRSESKRQHTVVSGFACAKAFLLEHKPENAAQIVELLTQTLPAGKRQGIMSQLQKLVNEWPLKVIKHQKEENKKALAAALQNDIPIMIAGLSSVSVEASVNIEDLATKAGVLS